MMMIGDTMFDWIQIGIIIILASTLVLVCAGIIYYLYAQGQARMRGSYILRDNLQIIAFGAVVLLCISLFLTIIATICYWTNATSLPFEYQSAVKTVDEIKELLNKDNASIGDGLESLQLKQSIKEAIKEKNDLHAKILAWLYNPLMPYKDIILERLPPDFF